MNKKYLILKLNNIENAKRINRLQVADLVLKNKILFKYLLETVFEFDNKLSIKAAWVLEFVCEKKLHWLFPYLSYFTKNINKIKFESALRPISKICGFLAKHYANKSKNKMPITNIHIEKLIEAGFDWLIEKHKVAVKVYTMEMLFLFGKNYDWVHKELQLILQKNILNESPAYQARGKKILSWINKNKAKNLG